MLVPACAGKKSPNVPNPTSPAPEVLEECEVAIVGGGAGGLHTAFRLGPTLGDKVCLFEKEEQLGGRIHDMSFDNNPASPRVGVGARRVMEGQTVLFALAEELGLTLETQGEFADLINARGVFGFAKDTLLSAAYPKIPADPDPALDQESWLYNQLRFGPQRANANSYPDFRSYIRSVSGEEEYEFLRDMSRFRGDFEYALDARGYLDFLDEEWDVCCTPSYPVGGMSTFITGMQAKARGKGVRIYTSEPVLSVDRMAGGFRLETAKRKVKAQKLVLAIPPVAFDSMTGDVIDDVTSQEEFQEIVGVKVVTITQWWPNAWWQDIRDPGKTEGNQIWRAWTTQHCVNFIEIPMEPYAAQQKVTRSVYDDDQRCVEFWENAAKQGTAVVEAEIARGLAHLFSDNGLSLPASVSIPTPLKTHVQIWPAAWHWLRAGAKQTNAQVTSWAVEPLPGEQVALVGEAFNPQRSTWSDGAFKSSIKLLNEKYGMDLPGLSAPVRADQAGRRRSMQQGRH